MTANAISIDRTNRKRKDATLRQTLGIGLMRLAYGLSLPFGNLGISRANRLIGRMFMSGGTTKFAINPHTTFTVPSDDYYWSLLYNYSYDYEPELKRVFYSFRELDYALLDLGANYGYWSILVSSPEFGSKPVIAVEASASSFEQLAANAAQRDGLVLVHQGAIWNVSSQVLEFFGTRHAGRSLVAGRSAEQQKESVTTITITDLASRYADFLRSGRGEDRRLVLKLDVEGVELAAVEGAAEVMDRIDVIIFEESNKPSFGETFFKLREMTGFSIYFFDAAKGAFQTVESPYSIYDPRRGKRALHSIGFNFIAVRPGSPFARQIEGAATGDGRG